MNKKKKMITIAIIAAVIIFMVGLGVYFYIKINNQDKTLPKTIEVLESIKGYDYKLEDRDTEIYKEKFSELKKMLESEENNLESYASLLAELFAIDLYTIDNKNSKYDVGGLDFIYQEDKEECSDNLPYRKESGTRQTQRLCFGCGRLPYQTVLDGRTLDENKRYHETYKSKFR